MPLTKRISFFILLALVFGPWIGFIACWIIGSPDVSLDLNFLLIHVVGVVGMLIWCIVFFKSSPRTARVGLVLLALYLILWGFALLS